MSETAVASMVTKVEQVERPEPIDMRPNLSPADIPHIHAAGGFGDMDLGTVTELMEALLVKPRPWME